MFNADLMGSRLRAARLARGMTQLQLARASGHPVATVSRFERGQTGGRLGVLADLVSALELDLDVLITGV